MTVSNPYAQQLLDQGYGVAETRTSAKQRTFPCVIGSRRFDTEQEYLDALHEFLNGI